MASTIKIAKAFGGNIVPILALGTNDQFGTAPATTVATATGIINALVASGAPRILGILPIKPSSAWDSNFTGGRTHEPMVGALRNLYRSLDVDIIPMDVDFNGEALFADGLHPNVSGNDRMAQLEVEFFANAF